MRKFFIASAIALFPALAGISATAQVAPCDDCVEVIVKKTGDLVYDPILGPSVSERPPLPIASDTCIERDYFDRCLRRASQPKQTDVYVKAHDGRLVRTDALGARVIRSGETATAVSPGKSAQVTDNP